MNEKICPICGTKVPQEATKCFSCKSDIQELSVQDDLQVEEYEEEYCCDSEDIENQPVEFLPTLLFAYFLGGFGIHRFYTGHTVLGVIQLLTFGGCGIWSFIDFILLCFNKFTDEQGRQLRKFDKNIGVVFFIIGLIPVFLIFLFVFVGILAAIVATTSSV